MPCCWWSGRKAIEGQGYPDTVCGAGGTASTEKPFWPLRLVPAEECGTPVKVLSCVSVIFREENAAARRSFCEVGVVTLEQ